LNEALKYGANIKAVVSSNPALLLPIKDDQTIDLSISIMLLAVDAGNQADIRAWISEILARANFAYLSHGRYPCNLDSYSELLDHPKGGDEKYRENVTSGSILYPTIALWAAILGNNEVYRSVANLKLNHLQHCNFQFWFPDDSSEEHIYTNTDSHGAVLSDVCVERTKEELMAQVFGECASSPQFKALSAVKFGWWPLVIVACRHYRLPLPLHLLEGLHKPMADANETSSNPNLERSAQQA
jgi:hypothetical protein